MFRTGHRAVLLAVAVAVLAPVHAGAAGGAAAAAYAKTREAHNRLTGDRKQQRFRHNWLNVIRGFEAVAEQHPESLEAPKALYNVAELWRAMCDVSSLRADLSEAAQAYGRLAERYGQSSLADDALYNQAVLLAEHWGDAEGARTGIERMLRLYPKGDMAAKGRALLARLSASTARPSAASAATARPAQGTSAAKPLTEVKALRFGRHERYSRVVAELTAPVEPPIAVTLQALAADDAADVPPRIVVDISAAAVQRSVATDMEASDPLVRGVRLERRDALQVRLVIDLRWPAEPRLELLEGPPRIVVDMVRSGASGAEPRPVAKPHPQAQPQPQRRRRRPLVVLDPGHGGRDTGATGTLMVGARGWQKVLEKDVALAVGKEAVRYLDAAGVDVLLTRRDDRFLTLKERTALANRNNAELFVSIHANSAPQPSVRGVETYFLDVTHDRYALRLAALENQTSEKEVSDLQMILADLSTKAHSRESQALARRLQKRIIGGVRTSSPQARDLGVKGALFYVLLGARMPAVLVEASFLSNPTEARLLHSTAYQRTVAKAIAEAVAEHLKIPVHVVQP